MKLVLFCPNQGRKVDKFSE